MTSRENPDGDIPLFIALPLIYGLLAADRPKKSYGLSRTQFVILLSLSYHEHLHMTQIAALIASSREQATRAVAHLVEERLVERFERPDNRARVYLRLTETGRAYMRECRAELNRSFERKTDAALTAQEKSELRHALETAIVLMEKIEV